MNVYISEREARRERENEWMNVCIWERDWMNKLISMYERKMGFKENESGPLMACL